MVQLTELKDDSPSAQDPQVIPAEPLNELEKKNGNDEEGEEEDSDFEEDFNENETLMERLIALKEIVSPNKRQSVCRFFDTTSVLLKKVFYKGGSLTWALTTSALLLGVPLSLSILAEQQLIEMEKTFDLQKDANELLTSNDEKQTIN